MDFTVEWIVSADVEKLVEAIIACRQGLTTGTFSKYGRAKLLTCDVYASPKVLELLQFATVPVQVKLHERLVMGDDTIRLVCDYDVDVGVDKTMYGNVKIVDMPESGRKA